MKLKHLIVPVISFLIIAPLVGLILAVKPFVAAAPETDAGTPGIAAGGGIQYLNSTELATYLDGLEDAHAKWVRFDFAWSDIQSVNATTFDWPRYDAVVAAANARNIEVLGMIGYTPGWALPAGCFNDKCHPNDPAQFAQFVSEVVNRYKDNGVKHWEIWNEPNIQTFWQPAPNVAQYSTLLQLSYQAAKIADPTSFVLNGGFSPAESNGTNIAPIDFLSGMYANGAKDYFDALSHHPYCYAGTFDCPTTYAPWSAWSQMSETPVNLRGIMTANSDASKKIWVTEFGAPTNGDQAVSEAQQATMLTDAYTILSSQTWAGPLFWYSYQDAGTDINNREDWFGMLRNDGSPKPSFAAFNALYVPPIEPPEEPEEPPIEPPVEPPIVPVTPPSGGVPATNPNPSPSPSPSPTPSVNKTPVVTRPTSQSQQIADATPSPVEEEVSASDDTESRESRNNTVATTEDETPDSDDNQEIAAVSDTDSNNKLVFIIPGIVLSVLAVSGFFFRSAIAGIFRK